MSLDLSACYACGKQRGSDAGWGIFCFTCRQTMPIYQLVAAVVKRFDARQAEATKAAEPVLSVRLCCCCGRHEQRFIDARTKYICAICRDRTLPTILDLFEERLSRSSPGTVKASESPLPMRLVCPGCGTLHIDEGEFTTKPHHTHCCQSCGLTWRPAVVPTVGVRFLPGFQNKGPVLS